MKVTASPDTVNTSHVIYMTRAEMVELAEKLIKMVGTDMRLNDRDATGVHLPPPPAMMIGEDGKTVMYSLNKG